MSGKSQCEERDDDRYRERNKETTGIRTHEQGQEDQALYRLHYEDIAINSPSFSAYKAMMCGRDIGLKLKNEFHATLNTLILQSGTELYIGS